MNYKVLITSRFEKELKKLSKKFSSLKMELSQLVSIVSNQPEFGTFMGNNSYKIRLAISSKGKGKGKGVVVELLPTFIILVIPYIYYQFMINLKKKI